MIKAFGQRNLTKLLHKRTLKSKKLKQIAWESSVFVIANLTRSLQNSLWLLDHALFVTTEYEW